MSYISKQKLNVVIVLWLFILLLLVKQVVFVSSFSQYKITVLSSSSSKQFFLIPISHKSKAQTLISLWLQFEFELLSLITSLQSLLSDLERSTREFEEAMLKDLSWLSLNWDEGKFLNLSIITIAIKLLSNLK